jgi:hypothetical protein
MQKQKVKTGVSLAVIIGSLGFLVFHFFGPSPKIDPRPHIGIGNVLAEQAAKALGSGGRITLITPDTTAFRWPGPEVQLKTFHKALAKAKLAVAATNSVKLDPGRPMRINAEDFLNLLRKQSEADVIVTLLSPAAPTAEQRARIPAKHARVVAVCTGELPKQVNLPALLEENIVHIAIVSRPVPALSVPQTDDPAAWFDHFYETVSTKGLAEISPSLRSP